MNEELTAKNVEETALEQSENGISFKMIEVPDFESPEAKEITSEADIKNLPTKLIRLRVSIVNHRLKEDDETFEEYKYRQSIINHRVNQYLKKGTLVWNSALLGSLNKEKVKQILKENEGNK